MEEVNKCQVVVWLCLSVIWPLYHLIHFRVELSKRVDHLSVTAHMCMYSMYVCVHACVDVCRGTVDNFTVQLHVGFGGTSTLFEPSYD